MGSIEKRAGITATCRSQASFTVTVNNPLVPFDGV